MLDPRRYRALTFDCYGTLIDWERGIGNELSRHCERAGIAPPPLDDFLVEFGRQETRIQQANPDWPYPRVLAQLFEHLCERFALPRSAPDTLSFGNSIGRWPPFPDSAAALARLQKHAKLIVVSNVDRASFARSAHALGIRFDGVVTAQDVGAYKPDHRMLRAGLAKAQELGVEPSGVLHVAQSLFHDIVPAHALGIANVWVDRRSGRTGGATPDAGDIEPDLRVESLAELADRMVG